MAWPRRTLKLRVDHDLAEALVGEADASLSPDALTRALRAHADCDQERRRLQRAIEKTKRDASTLEQAKHELEARYEGVIQENATLVAERRKLNEALQELRKQGQRG